MAAPQEYVKEKQVTHTRTEQHHKRTYDPLPNTLQNDRRWRGDGAYHLPRYTCSTRRAEMHEQALVSVR